MVNQHVSWIIYDGQKIPVAERATIMDAIVYIATGEPPAAIDDTERRFVQPPRFTMADPKWGEARNKLLYRTTCGELVFHGSCVLEGMEGVFIVPTDVVEWIDLSHLIESDTLWVKAGNPWTGTCDIAFIDLYVATADLFKLWPANGQVIQISSGAAEEQKEQPQTQMAHSQNGGSQYSGNPVGRPGQKGLDAKGKMLADLLCKKETPKTLSDMTGEALAAAYGLKRTRAVELRKEALSLFVGNSAMPVSDK